MVPEGWTSCELGTLADFSSGGTPSRQNSEFWNGGFPWVSGKDLKSLYLESSIDTLSKLGFQSVKKTPKGSTLVLVRGMTLLKDFPVGFANKEMAFNQDIKALVPKSNVYPLFLTYLLIANKPYIRQLVSTAGHGTGRIDTNRLKDFPVTKPPFEEQKKIANILSTWDKAIETVEQLIENSRAQKKALMQQLLTGKKRLPGFNKEWKKITIKQMGNVVSGGTPDTQSKDYWDGNIFWATPTDITALKSRFIGKTKRTISAAGVQNSSAQLLPTGSILVCTRATIGYLAIADNEITTNQGFKSLIPNNSFDSDFIYYLFKYNKYLFIRYACGSTFLEISKMDFCRLAFSIPELDEQKSIAQLLNNAGDEIRSLEIYRNKLISEKKALMQQLLTGRRRVKVDSFTKESKQG